jgi:sodium-independent sulfate anion transporter 11
MLLFRVVKARGWFLGRVKVQSMVGNADPFGNNESDRKAKGFALSKTEALSRDVFLPMDHRDGSNPQVEISFPYPGIFIYRFSEGFNYPNANHYLDHLTEIILKNTRRTNPQSLEKLGVSAFIRPVCLFDNQSVKGFILWGR